jgi:hypothetical protein
MSSIISRDLELGGDFGHTNCMTPTFLTRGAKLTVGAQQAIPEEFTLVPSPLSLVRGIDSQIGVEFLAGR